MDLKLARALGDMFENEGEEFTVLEHYSGRGMYGEETVALQHSISSVRLLTLVIEHVDDFVDEDGYPKFEEIGHLQTDDMGHDFVLY